jgi:hypothetical protein
VAVREFLAAIGSRILGGEQAVQRISGPGLNIGGRPSRPHKDY